MINKATRGVSPRMFWLEDRIAEVDACIMAHLNERTQIPLDLLEERGFLLDDIERESLRREGYINKRFKKISNE